MQKEKEENRDEARARRVREQGFFRVPLVASMNVMDTVAFWSARWCAFMIVSTITSTFRNQSAIRY